MQLCNLMRDIRKLPVGLRQIEKLDGESGAVPQHIDTEATGMRQAAATNSRLRLAHRALRTEPACLPENPGKNLHNPRKWQAEGWWLHKKRQRLGRS